MNNTFLSLALQHDASLPGRLGVSKRTIYQWLDGTRQPSDEHEAKLFKLFGKSFAELMRPARASTTLE
jgi:transcriptional regulator with XRE-family HTH domain